MKTKKAECSHIIKYSDEYDAYYCKKCNQWLEETCGNEKCEFCANQLDKPRECENEE